MRHLRDREDEDEVVEQLQRGGVLFDSRLSAQRHCGPRWHAVEQAMPLQFAAPEFVNVNGRRLAYENVGHIPEVECADNFNRDLEAFLQ